MKAIFFTFLFLSVSFAHAQTQVPSGVQCMKQGKSLGLSMIDAYQVCSVKDSTKSCIFKQLRENKALTSDKKELAKLGKAAIKECQE